MFDDDAWQDFREDCLRFAKEENDAIVKEWLDKIGYYGTVGYYRNNSEHVMEIYTRHPEWLIGKGGQYVDDFIDMLSNKFGGAWNVKFIEVNGGFVSRP